MWSVNRLYRLCFYVGKTLSIYLWKDICVAVYIDGRHSRKGGSTVL